MAFKWQHGKKPLLYSDLFKSHRYIVPGKEEEENSNSVISKVEGSSWNSSSSRSSPCGSSWSGISDLSSSESDDGDFMADLTRQMAECMLQEEEEENNSVVDQNNKESCADYDATKSFTNGFNSSPVQFDDRIPPVQMYELKNQTPVSKDGPVSRGRQVKGRESGQQKTGQLHYMQHRGRDGGIRRGRNGSGMQAVFLGGSKSGPTGTGVFLPHLIRDPTELKKKSGCSIVLMPTRVLQALELHFKQRQHATVPPLSGGSPIHSGPKDKWSILNGVSQLENKTANRDEMQLPQEWTY